MANKFERYNSCPTYSTEGNPSNHGYAWTYSFLVLGFPGVVGAFYSDNFLSQD